MGATATVLAAHWTPDQRRESYFRLFLAMLEAQKHICLNECSADGADHVLACLEMNEVLIEAEAVLDDWQD